MGGWWGSDPGNIEEATFLIERKGIYTEVEMFLTFAHAWGNVGTDSLEIVLDFNLPKGSIIHDSWLWIYDTPVQADMLDKWTAIQTYEDIVDRRTDPSLLFEKDGGFQLRIYPLTADERRKVKITMLLPTKWSSDYVLTSLPTHILSASYDELPSYRVLIKPTDEWGNPTLMVTANGAEFTPINDPEFGDVLEMVVQEINHETLRFDAPLEEGVYLNTYEGAENIYQLVLDPAEFGIFSEARKIVFCIDVESTSGGSLLATIWDKVRDVGELVLTENDSFNVVYKGTAGTFHLLYNGWQSFEADNFAGLPLLYDGSDIVGGLVKSNDFIQSNGGEGDIVLISNSNEINSNSLDFICKIDFVS